MSLPNTNTINLSHIMPANTVTKEILAPGGVEGTGWMIEFAGPGHDKTVAWSNEAARKSLRKAELAEAAQVNSRKYKPESRSADEARRENVNWVVARIVNWTPAPDFGDGPVEFSEKAATELLINPEMGWVFSQMVEWLADDRTFIKASGTN